MKRIKTYNAALNKISNELHKYRDRNRRRIDRYGAIAGLDEKVYSEVHVDVNTYINNLRKLFWTLDKIEDEAWARINEVSVDKMASRNAPQA